MHRPSQPGQALRTAFISDVHLGSPHCHATELAQFLAGLRCERLYLVGDIVDLWWLASHRAHWGPAQDRVMGELRRLHRSGVRIVYVPGNHDRPARRLCGLVLPGMEIRRRAIHVAADGRRLLVVHGDEYDGQTQSGNLDERFGHWLYYRILAANKLLNQWRRGLGYRYWSLAEFLKRRSTKAEAYVARYVDAGIADVRRQRLDGIICGHVHRATLQLRGDLVYANDGDWVESLTALVEDADGGLRLLSHLHETLARLPPRPAAVVNAQAMGRAA